MSEAMTFPETVEEFMEQYKIVDNEQVYTNGAELVPIFRMRQWFEHLGDVVPVVHGHWIQEGEPPMYSLTCSNCGQKYFNHYLQPHANYCSMCGAKMDEVSE